MGDAKTSYSAGYLPMTLDKLLLLMIGAGGDFNFTGHGS